MANPLLSPDGKHPELGSGVSMPRPKPPGMDAATDDFATCPQPFGRTLAQDPVSGESYVSQHDNMYDSD